MLTVADPCERFSLTHSDFAPRQITVMHLGDDEVELVVGPFRADLGLVRHGGRWGGAWAVVKRRERLRAGFADLRFGRVRRPLRGGWRRVGGPALRAEAGRKGGRRRPTAGFARLRFGTKGVPLVSSTASGASNKGRLLSRIGGYPCRARQGWTGASFAPFLPRGVRPGLTGRGGRLVP